MINLKKENLERISFLIDFLKRFSEYDGIDLSINLTRTKASPLFIIEILKEMGNLTDDINFYYFREKLKDKYKDRFSKREDINREINHTIRLALKELEKMGILTLIKVQGKWKIKNIQQERLNLAIEGLEQINTLLNSKFVKIESNRILEEIESPTKRITIENDYDKKNFLHCLKKLEIPVLKVSQHILIPNSWILLINEQDYTANDKVWNIRRGDIIGGDCQVFIRNQDILRNLAEPIFNYPKHHTKISYNGFKTSESDYYVVNLLIHLVRQSDHGENTEIKPIQAPALVIFTKKSIMNPLKMLDNNLKKGKYYSDEEKPRGLYQVLSNCFPIKTDELDGKVSEFLSNPSLPLFVGIGFAPQSTILWNSLKSMCSKNPLFVKLRNLQRWSDNDLLSLLSPPNTIIGPCTEYLFCIRPSEKDKLKETLQTLGVIKNTLPTEIREILENEKGLIGKENKYKSFLYLIRKKLSKIRPSEYARKYKELKNDIRIDKTCYLTFFFKPEGKDRCLSFNLIEYKECILHFNKNKKIRLKERDLIVQPFAKEARLISLCSIYQKKKSEFMKKLFPLELIGLSILK